MLIDGLNNVENKLSKEQKKMPSLTDNLRADYLDKWNKMKVDEDADLVAHEASRVLEYRDRYQKVSDETGVPWYVIGVIHMRESDFNFSCHLHNGDPLSARTYHRPRGRPIKGSPPFTWEFSAQDALQYDDLAGLDPGKWKDLAFILFRVELYNGWGYQRRNTESPYLWSKTNQYERGKFVDDGKFSAHAVDSQCGCAPVLQAVFGLTKDDSFGTIAAANTIVVPQSVVAGVENVPTQRGEDDSPPTTS